MGLLLGPIVGIFPFLFCEAPLDISFLIIFVPLLFSYSIKLDNVHNSSAQFLTQRRYSPFSRYIIFLSPFVVEDLLLWNPNILTDNDLEPFVFSPVT